MGARIYEPTTFSELKNNGREQVTLFVISYNQEKYIKDAILGAFSQTYSPLEIVLSDDCSNDDTFNVMQQMVIGYNGPHKIILNRNETNIGLVNHINWVMKLSSSKIIVAGAGDDISLPDRVENTVKIFSSYSDVYSVFMNVKCIDINGSKISTSEYARFIIDDRKYTLEEMINRNRLPILGASHGWRRESYDNFGPLGANCPAEDLPLRFRSLLLGKIFATNTHGIHYRIDTNSNQSGKFNRKSLTYFIYYRQFLHQNYIDLKWAKDNNIIDEPKYNIVRRFLCENNKRRMLELKCFKGKIKLFSFLRYIFFAKHFTNIEKVNLLFDCCCMTDLFEFAKRYYRMANKILNWRNYDIKGKAL